MANMIFFDTIRSFLLTTEQKCVIIPSQKNKTHLNESLYLLVAVRSKKASAVIGKESGVKLPHNSHCRNRESLTRVYTNSRKSLSPKPECLPRCAYKGLLGKRGDVCTRAEL